MYLPDSLEKRHFAVIAGGRSRTLYVKLRICSVRLPGEEIRPVHCINRIPYTLDSHESSFPALCLKPLPLTAIPVISVEPGKSSGKEAPVRSPVNIKNPEVINTFRKSPAE